MSQPDTQPQTDEEQRTIQLPAQTVDVVSDRIERTEFDTVEEYATFALDQLLYELDRADDTDCSGPEDKTGTEQPAVDDGVSDRLESLGYR